MFPLQQHTHPWQNSAVSSGVLQVEGPPSLLSLDLSMMTLGKKTPSADKWGGGSYLISKKNVGGMCFKIIGLYHWMGEDTY